jgi:hypothetical protein
MEARRAGRRFSRVHSDQPRQVHSIAISVRPHAKANKQYRLVKPALDEFPA